MTPVLTAAEMREVDRRTMDLGISGPILMENAGHRVVEFLAERFAPLSRRRIAILCGKGNNGGDGYVIARQLHTRFHPEALWVQSVFGATDSEPRRMLEATGCSVIDGEFPPEARTATLVIDAVLGTGVTGAAKGRALEAIRAINQNFPLAKVVAVDLPSGMFTDGGTSEGEVARADATVTFTAPKLCHVLSPNCDRMGEIRVAQIGSPARLMEDATLFVNGPEVFRDLLAPRKPDSNKGSYGHVLVAGGADGKFGAAEMSGLAALRAGAGLVTVASEAPRLDMPELMTEALPHTWPELAQQMRRRNVLAIGPGLGDRHYGLAVGAVEQASAPVVVDADALNALAAEAPEWRASDSAVRILTPHPGEMARLMGVEIADVQRDRIAAARNYARSHRCIIVLKGHRTVIATPSGQSWINPTGSPALAKGGTGDILTGLIAGMLAQYPDAPEKAALAAVWLHGRCGELGAAGRGERNLLATELLDYLPEAMRIAASDV